MTMFIHFFCLCPPGLTIKLNFNILKAIYQLALVFRVVQLVIALKKHFSGIKVNMLTCEHANKCSILRRQRDRWI